MTIYENTYWRIFLFVIALIVIAYTANTFIKIYQYQRLNYQTHVQSIQWIVMTESDETFVLEGHYQFLFNETLYQGQMRWDELYVSHSNAEAVAERLNQAQWNVWFDSSYPYDSSLQKDFPFKQSISTVILWTLFVYFFWLGQYVQAYTQKRKY